MAETVKVLIWGTAEQGPCAYFRGHMYDEELKKHGIEMRHIDKVNFIADPSAQGMSQAEASAKGLLKIDTSDIDWADVVVFRRYYNSSAQCMDKGCNFRTKSPVEAMAHPHEVQGRDGITDMMWPAFNTRAHNKAIIYETDDNHFKIRDWNGYYYDVKLEWDVIEQMARRADLVTVSTGPIKDEYSRFNDNIRVIRNAIDPSIYTSDIERPVNGGDLPRVVYYGSTVRMRDYAGEWDPEHNRHKGGFAGKAVEELRSKKKLWNIFIGVNPGTEHVIAPYFDEAHYYVENIKQFSKTLANAKADIGIAPLVGDEFDRCKSELHWLEYAITGAAFVGEGFRRGEAPYSMIRHGVDGFLARTAQEWYSSMKSLVESKDLRQQIAGAAKERVLLEYDYKVRAKEWADAYRWAAEHPNYGLRERGD